MERPPVGLPSFIFLGIQFLYGVAGGVWGRLLSGASLNFFGWMGLPSSFRGRRLRLTPLLAVVMTPLLAVVILVSLSLLSPSLVVVIVVAAVVVVSKSSLVMMMVAAAAAAAVPSDTVPLSMGPVEAGGGPVGFVLGGKVM